MSKRKRSHSKSWIPPQKNKAIRRFIPKFDIGDIHLRPLTSADAFAHKRMCDFNSDYFYQYLGFAENIQYWNLGQHKAWLELNQSVGYPFENYGAFYEDNLLGSFSYGRSGDLLGTQICYYIGRESANMGIATEVTNVLVEKAFTLAGFAYVELHIDSSNIPSQKVAKKTGFELAKEYSSEKIGSKGTGTMQLWIRTNPNNQHGITLENFKNDDYNYLIPVYQNIQTAIDSAAQMKIVADKINRAKLALAGKIPLEEVQDILDDYYKHNPEVA